jgi:hypothetical protein
VPTNAHHPPAVIAIHPKNRPGLISRGRSEFPWHSTAQKIVGGTILDTVRAEEVVPCQLGTMLRLAASLGPKGFDATATTFALYFSRWARWAGGFTEINAGPVGFSNPTGPHCLKTNRRVCLNMGP